MNHGGHGNNDAFCVVRIIIAVVLIAAACSKADSSGDSTGAARDTSTAATADPASPTWTGRYALRGTIEGNRQAAGTLTVTPLEPGSATHDSTRQRIRGTYPSYAGPLYRAELALAAGDSVRSTFTCANSPATPPSLVCHPAAPIPQLRDAALVVQPDGRATLSGSHGEGVTAEYGRFTWERTSGD